jgi:hypothetical protein
MKEDEQRMYNLAPINTAVLVLEWKTKLEGLGYTARPGLERRIEKPARKVSSSLTASGITMRGSIGCGIENEEGDEDPYEVGLSREIEYGREDRLKSFDSPPPRP